MPLDPKDQETKDWLTIAKSDLGAGKSLGSNEDFATQATFHAQQAAEKALKAFLVWNKERFGKQHDIRYLGDIVLKKDPSLADVIDEAVNLNPYAVTARYPGGPTDIPADEVEEALATAEKLFNEVLARLPTDVHPE